MNEQAKYLPADERRSATVEAVVDLAAQQNPSDITTTAIAQHMGLTQGALFRHFPSKDAILQAVMTWVAERLLLRLDKAAGPAASPTAALQAVFMAHIGFVSERPGVPRLIVGGLERVYELGRVFPMRVLIRVIIRNLRFWKCIRLSAIIRQRWN